MQSLMALLQSDLSEKSSPHTLPLIILTSLQSNGTIPAPSDSSTTFALPVFSTVSSSKSTSLSLSSEPLYPPYFSRTWAVADLDSPVACDQGSCRAAFNSEATWLRWDLCVPVSTATMISRISAYWVDGIHHYRALILVFQECRLPSACQMWSSSLSSSSDEASSFSAATESASSIAFLMVKILKMCSSKSFKQS